MKISTTSIFVQDQARAAAFYTEVLGFVVRHDVPVGEHRWLTVVSPEDPEGTELLLEPNVHPAAKAYMEALYAEGIPAQQFEVADLAATVENLKEAGVRFSQDPTPAGPVEYAVLDDTCGNYLQLVSPLQS
ncbi:VOC family protein [Corynebacterium sp. 153RC1]|uniref:VOC family protein n=1 Tax=unclassified Corynebacterium TaxID=2624378 RepID=UPI00211CDAB1|nr:MULTISPECIES: VOC family protein [unclassified Corynebacterium]MCQ9371548.1 VOC family protein [Corynebacterium sp. 35RC1]MCQ9352102.1 VOC family protein [Corynebacterium sp. 209RC1]MCQ9354104.1 VOC family protein [Corynebacterium sp. 1222RC1]MCQ9356384.1 VOC family protein [Corynebacterium sp. 122RC1]MCQ9358486.1 VOC family protein [Corynebacterium sp. 142RC1]